MAGEPNAGQVYSVDEFTTKKNHFERPGNFYHPLIAVMITAGSRLFLAMAEARLREHGAHHAYMDTDSFFCPARTRSGFERIFNL